MNRPLLLKQLIRHEGLRLKPYTDTVGKLTIGVGRNLTDVGLSDDEVQLLLDNDVNRAVAGCRAEIPCFDGLDDDRQAVLIDMAFNLGMDRLMEFVGMLSALDRGDFDRAADAMLQSKWASQVGQRAIDLSLQMRGT